jgi:hypothetical protein
MLILFLQTNFTFQLEQEVGNGVGACDYFFTLTIEGIEPNTTTTTTTEGPSTTSGPPDQEVNY